MKGITVICEQLLQEAEGLFDNREYLAALTVYEQLLAADNDHVEGMTGRALCLFYAGRFEEAIIALQQLLELLPESDQLRLILIESLLLAKRNAEAQQLLEMLTAASPDNLEAWLRLGRLHLDQEQYQEASRCITVALALDPNQVEALGYIGMILIRYCQFDEAMEALTRAWQHDPQNVLVLNNLGRASKMMGRPEEALNWYRKALAVESDNACIISNYLFALNYCQDVEPAMAAAEHFRLAPRCCPPGEVPALVCGASEQAGRLRIGYLSGDLYTHSVAYFLEPVMQHYDRSRFELFCYSVGKTQDITTERLKGLADCWRDLSGTSPDAIARIIVEDQIAILVDLSGHTGDNRLGVFALRAAPVQVSWIGYPATTGLPQMDYYLTDSYCDPPGMTEPLYCEQLCRLPRIFSCYLPPLEFPTISPLPYHRNKAITFGCFNNFAKVANRQIQLWAAILAAVPDSRLYLKSMALGTDSVKRGVLEQFATFGVAPERILMRVVTSTPLEHLAEYGNVDIALDTYPYHGTTTTCEALWMGTPVITLAGSTHASRVGVSLLQNVGCPELIAATEDEYLQLAVELAGDSSRIQQYRQELRSSMACSPLMDAASLTRELEQVFDGIWADRVRDPECG